MQHARVKQDLNQKMLSDCTGVGVGTISSLECGSSEISFFKIIRVFRLLGLSLDEFADDLILEGMKEPLK